MARRASDVMTQQDTEKQTGMASVPKTLVKRKLRLHTLYFPRNTLMLTESRGEFSDLHSIFGLRALRYWSPDVAGDKRKARGKLHTSSYDWISPRRDGACCSLCTLYTLGTLLRQV